MSKYPFHFLWTEKTLSSEWLPRGLRNWLWDVLHYKWNGGNSFILIYGGCVEISYTKFFLQIMIYVWHPLQIARLSVVGIDGRPVYDSLIQPENPIIDYNTRFSGLTERDFRRGEKGSSTSASGPPVKVHFLIVRLFFVTNISSNCI